MATIHITDEGRQIHGEADIQAFLQPHGIQFQRWPLDERVDPDAPAEEILAAYEPEISELKKQGGYVAADVISVLPDTPGLDLMLAKFDKEHTHSEDEVRFILKGTGVFHVRPRSEPVFAIEVSAGDLISVPLGTRHWFQLCPDRTIRAIRLFQATSGWTPEYSQDGLHEKYMPVCWGPKFVLSSEIESSLK